MKVANAAAPDNTVASVPGQKPPYQLAKRIAGKKSRNGTLSPRYGVKNARTNNDPATDATAAT
jgi:hypothetical protein